MGLLYRLLPLAALAYFWSHAPTRVKTLASALVNGPKVMMTSVDMDTARNAIALEYTSTERFPSDVGSFLQSNINGLEHPELDRWGSPYRLENVPEDPVLISSGPDTSFSTADDLNVRVIHKKRPGDADTADDKPLPSFEN